MRLNSAGTTMGTRNRNLRMWLAAGVLAAACAALLGQAARGKMNMKIQAEMLSPEFVLGEMVQVRLTIANTSGQTIQVPDPLLNELEPEYTLTGPESGKVSLGHARIKGAITDPMAPPIRATMELAPGQKWSELVPLDPMILLSQPGQYKLQVAYGQAAATTAFAIIRPKRVLFDVAPEGSFSTGARLLTPWAGDTHIVDAIRLGHQWGDDRRGKLFANPVFRTSEVTQIAAAVNARPPGMEFKHWMVWAEGSKVWALSSVAGQPSGKPLNLWNGTEGLRLVRPAAIKAGNRLTIFLVEPDNSLVEIHNGQARRIALPIAPEVTAAVHLEDGRSLVAVSDRRRIVVVEDGKAGHPMEMNVGLLAMCLDRDGLSWVGFPAGGERLLLQSAPFSDLQTVQSTEIDSNTGRPVWAALSGKALLWRDAGGALYYQVAGGRPSAVKTGYESDPPPMLIVSDGQAFIAGVKRDGGFGVERRR